MDLNEWNYNRNLLDCINTMDEKDYQPDMIQVLIAIMEHIRPQHKPHTQEQSYGP